MIAATEDTDAELGFLRCAFIDAPEVIAYGLKIGLSEAAFTSPKYALLFETMLQMVRSSEPVDVETLWIRLKPRIAELQGEFLEITSAELSTMVANASTTARAKIFAQRIVDCAKLRILQARTREISEQVKDAGTEPADDILRRATAALLAIEAAKPEASWSDEVAAALVELEGRTNPLAERDEKDKLTFGFPHLDATFGLMRAGQLVVLAARPSVGKSSLAGQIATHAALRLGQQVLFCSMEVMGKSLALKLAQTEAGVSLSSLTTKSHPKDIEFFRKALEAVNTPRLEVIASASLTLAAIQARCEVLRARQNPVRLVVIDYLQLMSDCNPDKGENRAQSVGRVSRALKRLAGEQNCVVLMLSQLNRESAKEEREPRMEDLRESGDIEQDADKIILLHRPRTNPITNVEQDSNAHHSECPSFWIKAIQAKGRDDGTGYEALIFRRAITRFEEPRT